MTMQTISATDFKATCLELLDRVGSGEIDGLAITKRGRVVALLRPPQPTAAEAASFHGFLKGSVELPDDLDLTAPVFEGGITAERGKLHE